VLFQKMLMYWNRGDLRYLMELCPGFAPMQRNLKSNLVKVSRGWKAILESIPLG